jgi:hypothetical protein
VAEAPELTIPINANIAEDRNQPRLVALILCDYANLTEDRKYNLLGTFDSIVVDRKKRQSPLFILYLRTYSVYGGQMQIGVYSPTNELVSAVGVDLKETENAADRGAHGVVVLKVQFDVQEEGEYWIDVSYKGRSLGGDSLVVNFRSEEGEP